MHKLLRFVKFIKNNEKGNVLIIVAASLILLMGMTALVIDVGQLYVVRRQMVNAADAAALAGALETKSNEKFARAAADEYATFNGAEDFCEDNDVFFSGDDEFRIISVRTAKEVHFTFARILGFDSSIVQAVASAQAGPGNPLVPFVDYAFECDECCECSGECICNSEPCECADECDCSVDRECKKCGGLGYFIRTEECEDDPMGYQPAEPGDHFEIKYDRWQDWIGVTSGNFPYLRFPDKQGADDLYEGLAGGYTGDLKDVDIGEVLRGETGQTQGKLREAMLTRMTIHGEPYCKYDAWSDDCVGWYKCDLVVVVPIVIHSHDQSNDKWYEIVGYASLLLDGDSYGGDKYVEVWFLEYLTYEKLKNEVMPEYLEGFVTRLVQDPEAALNYFSTNPAQVASQ